MVFFVCWAFCFYITLHERVITHTLTYTTSNDIPVVISCLWSEIVQTSGLGCFWEWYEDKVFLLWGCESTMFCYFPGSNCSTRLNHEPGLWFLLSRFCNVATQHIVLIFRHHIVFSVSPVYLTAGILKPVVSDANNTRHGTGRAELCGEVCHRQQ